MSEIIRYDEPVLKRQFIELYYLRGSEDDPAKLMAKIKAPRRMLTEWIAEDPDFQKELERIDAERAWMAKEVIYRKITEIFENVAGLATERNRMSMRAAELMFKIAGILKTAGGGAQTNVTINNTLGQEVTKGMSLEELVNKRDEVASLLAQLEAEPADFEETAD